MLRVDHAAIIDILDACYAREDENEAWGRHALALLMRMANTRSGSFFRFTSGYQSGQFRLRSVDDLMFVGPEAVANEAAHGALLHATIAEALFGKTQGTVASKATGFRQGLNAVPGWHDCWSPSIVDTLGFVGIDAAGDGVAICTALDQIGTLSSREARLLGRLATHLSAANRLRLVAQKERLSQAEGVLSHDGKILHAPGTSVEAMRTGFAARDYVRKNRHDAEKALEVWQGLVEGRWSLVDHFDTDGKRYLLAMRNEPHVAPRAALAPKERRVAALAAMGHSDKEIAYTLGVTPSAVNASLRRARRKLRARTRTELAVMWRRVAAEEY
jgi:DNA-binding CsgD family transcriptional regulator